MSTDQNLSSIASHFDQYEASDTFDKRPGTTDKGKEYEDLKIAQIAINLLELEDVIDFQIWGNDAQYGSIDDVIAIVTKQNGDVMRIAIQLKHSTGRDKIVTRNELTGPKGSFSLLKYFNDYQEAVEKKPHLANYIFLLQTNKSICNEQMQFGEDLIIQPEEVDDPVASLLVNSSTAKPLRFVINQTKSKKSDSFRVKYTNKKESKQGLLQYNREEFQNFLQHFYFCPQQSNVEETRVLCAEAFKRNFLSSEVKQFLDFVQDWSKRDGTNKPKLTRGLVSAKIAECLLSPFIRVYPERKAENAHLFLKAIHQFDATLIDEENAAKLDFLWSEDDVKEMQTDNDFGLKRSGLNWDLKDVQKLFWHVCGKLLIVSLSEDNSDIVSKALSLCRGRRKLIFVTNGQAPKLPEGDIFQNFDNLKRKDANLFKSIGESLKISLEGKEAIPLNEILGDEQVRTQLTPSHFLQMLEGPLSIGQSQDRFPDYYISRFVTDYNIDFNYVNNMDTHKYVALICSDVDFSQVRDKFPNISEWSNLASDDDSKNLYFCNIAQKEIAFEQMCNKIKSKNCGCLEYHDSSLKWLASNKIDPKFHEFQRSIPETEILTEDYLLNIICNDPGMGKTWLLKRLKLNYPLKLVIYIEPKNHSFFCKQEPSQEEYDNFLLSVAFKNKNALEEAILKSLYLKKRVVILWDGLDEASQEKLPNILNAIDYFKKIGLTQWIASREHLREKLENRFNILSRSLTRLNETQQEEYIKQRLPNNGATIDSCENITRKIMNQLRPNYINELFGIPLQLFMLTELFLDPESNISEELTSGRFSIATLYQHFLDGKFKFHEEEKIGWKRGTANDQLADLLLKNRKSVEANFEKAAIHAIFAAFISTMMTRVNISCDQFLDDIVQNGDNYGIITSVVPDMIGRQEINFAHQTYGEYLAARYFTKNYKYIDNVVTLTEETFNNVRFFFDVMMAQGSELHLAVLYKDVEKVKRLEKSADCKDRLGRNPLTLAALQGKYNWRRYYLSPNGLDHFELPSPLPKDDDALAEIFSDLSHSYEVDERDEFLFKLLLGKPLYDDSTPHWALQTMELLESVPAPSYVDRHDGHLFKWLAISNLPSDEFATRCLFGGMKAKYGRDSTSTSAD